MCVPNSLVVSGGRGWGAWASPELSRLLPVGGPHRASQQRRLEAR